MRSSAVVGLLTITPAIGSGWGGTAYEAVTALLTMTAGAVAASATAEVGQVLPLALTAAALRLALA